MQHFWTITCLSTLFIIFISSNDTEAQIIKTNLSVFVVDELGNIQPSAKVSLYENEKDYVANANAIREVKTNEKGKIKIKNLSPKSYFIRVEKGSKDNTGGGVKTGKLAEKKVNKINIVISEL